MGLDISAYERVELVRAKSLGSDDDDDCAEDEYYFYAFPDGKFPHATPGGFTDGVYRVSGLTAGFRAGSYGGYNVWREALAAMVGRTVEEVWRTHTPGPFYELIDFADNEGVLVASVCRKLSQDFKAHRTVAQAYAETMVVWLRESFLEIYEDFANAFELVGDSGLVEFH